MVRPCLTVPRTQCRFGIERLPEFLSAVNYARAQGDSDHAQDAWRAAWERFAEAIGPAISRRDAWRRWSLARSPRCMHVLRGLLTHRFRESLIVDDREAVAAMLRRAEADADGQVLESLLDVFLDRPSRRLAVYGSLGPGRANHHRVESLRGTWSEGWLTGSLSGLGRGARMGYPGLKLKPSGQPIEAAVLESDRLVSAWPDLDEFEGRDYTRSLALLRRTDGSEVVANVYAIR